MEQADVQVEAKISMMSLGRALSDEVRASIAAVREAEEAARQRARRQTIRTRIWFAAVVGTVGAMALAVGPRIARGRHGRPSAAVTATAAATSASTVPEDTTPPAAPAPIGALAAATPEPPARPAPQPSTVAEPRRPSSLAGADENCDTGLIRKAPWRLSAQACARAFDANPTNAALALAIAHAEHAHGSVSDAAGWARRALDLDPNAAEAYVLIGRAEKKDGRPEEARAAYRRYLELAPRGWHQAEARAALARE